MHGRTGTLEQNADAGDAAAKTALAEQFVSKPPYDVPQGIRLAREASDAGDAAASHLLAVVGAEGLGIAQDWSDAFDHLVAAATRGHALAQNELAALAGDWDAAYRAASPGQDWRALRRAIDLPALLAVPRLRVMSESPRMAVAEKFLSPSICDWLIARARPQTTRAAVFDIDRGGEQLTDVRSNRAVCFNVAAMDMVTVTVRARLARLCGLPLPGFEDSAILHYRVGEEYKPHYDFLDPTPAMAAEIASGGQRVATLLIYLNDGYEGGETDFPVARRRYKGRKGDALLFFNVTPSGAPDPLTLHAGTPPRSGEKWLFSQWVRRRVA